LRERSDPGLNAYAPDLPCDTFADGLFQMIQDGEPGLRVRVGPDAITGADGEMVRVLKPTAHRHLAAEGHLRHVTAVGRRSSLENVGACEAPSGRLAAKTACVVRYGAIGDTLQATSASWTS
jgi:hypothetical protein